MSQGYTMIKKPKQVVVALVVMGVITAILGSVKFIQIRQAIAEHANFKMPPESVTTEDAKEVVWNERWETIGSLSAVQGVELAAEEAGRVVRIGVESGAKVEKGQMLIELDTAVEEANLKGAAARLELARKNLTRSDALKTQSALSLATLEDAQAKLRQAEADVSSLKAVIERKKIIAPFSGRAGIRMVNIGQYVAQGTMMLPLFSVDPIYVNFSVPQQVSSKVNAGSKVSITVDAVPGATFEGMVSAVNPNVDVSTRTLGVQATIDNKEEKLRPGMFTKLFIDFGTPRKVIVIPTSSVAYAPYGDAVFVVSTVKGPDGVERQSAAAKKIVQLGERRGDYVEVISGVQPGDKVVSTGAFKVRDGSDLAIHNEKAPTLSENPVVQDS
jgi:membrane fusion protein (multidrug efflux system)